MDAAPRFLTVCLNPTLQKTLVVSSVRPGEVNRCLKSRLDASGKGVNVARVLVQLGERCTHLTHTGGRFRRTFIALAEQSGMSLQSVDSKSEIRFCTTMIELETDTTTELVETSERVCETTEARLRRAYNALVEHQEAVVISGTKASGYSDQIIPDLVSAARKRGCRVVLDVHGTDLVKSLEAGPDVVKPNFCEFAATFEPDLIDCKPTDALAAARIEARMRQLSLAYGCAFVVTRGSRATLVSEAGESWQQPPEQRDIVNPIGSGDAFAAGLASALVRRNRPRDAVAEGNRCGLLNAQQLAPGNLGVSMNPPQKLA
jgi:1-phosphofructokinase/tagatose 6-phosphate kinase